VGTQVLPLQQPVGHELESQMHCPVAVLQACPVAHAPQVPPAVPHEALDSEAYASQVPVGPPLQQPLGHVLASQVQRPSVVSHTPFVHALQAAPPVPHSDGD
jgi:hypothetical protein